MGKCKFAKEWLDKKDANGYKISVWAERRDNDLFCTVCERTINVAKGFCAIKQHFETPKHQSNFSLQKDKNQLQFACAGTSDSTIRLYSVKDSAYTAELIWCLKIVSGNVSANFSQDISSTFRAMFPTEGAIPEGFSLNPTKVGYLMTDALGPYFRNKVLKEIGSSYFTLMFDETTNTSGFKELQTAVRFWSEDKNEVVSHHLETFHLGHATADIIKKHIFLALNNANLEVSKLLMLGSDAPKVNKKVFGLVNEEVKSLRGKGLVNFGFCNIHLVHNAFQKGLEELGSDASELIIAIYYYFKEWPSRWEDLLNIQKEKNLPKRHFIKHVSSRWLTIEPAANRVLEQWDAVMEYFLKFIPMHQRDLMKTNAYKRIIPLLKKKSIKAELKFVCSSAGLFTEFTRLFQSHQPLIHVLHEHLKCLVIKIMTRCCKKEAIDAFRYSPSEDAFLKTNLLPIEEFLVSDEMKSLISNLSLSEKNDFISQIFKHYTAAGNYILEKDVLSSRVLRSFNCLKPDKIKLKVNAKRFKIMASSLPVIYDEEQLMDEWRLVQLETMKSDDRIDRYWSQCFSFKNLDGTLKYQNIAMVIKAALSLSHGNAEVERGFSKSGRIMTDERASMSVRTLNARLNIVDGLQRYENKPHLVPITDELIYLARTAYKSYEIYLDEQKQRADEEKRKIIEDEKFKALEEEKLKKLEQSKNDIGKWESQLKAAKGMETVQISAVSELLEDANDKLRDAIKKKDFTKAQVAQAILEGAMKNNAECSKKRKAIISLEKRIDKKKDSVITTFFPKKPRNA